MTRPEHYRSYSAVFPILLREGANGREVLLHLRQNTGYMDGCCDGRTYYDLCFVIRKYDGTPAVMEPDKNAGLRWFPTEALPENISTAVEVMLRPCLRGQPYSEVIHDLPVTSI